MATVPAMPRVLLAALAVSVLLSVPISSSASSGPSSPETAEAAIAGKVVLRGRLGAYGPWRSYLWLKLRKGGLPTTFSICAVWDQPLLTPACRAAPGKNLPEGTAMRLEQRRMTPKRAAGWKRVGFSPVTPLEAVLSNDLSGNRLGVVAYRVTVRNASGRLFHRSNTLRVFWHK
jgi:hypothetical protein